MKSILSRLFILFLGIISYQLGWSQGNYIKVDANKFGPAISVLTGKISKKEDHQPLAKATVEIPDLQLRVFSDDSGYYKFKAIPAGTYLVEIQYVGFKTLTRSVHVNGTTIANFELAEQPIEESSVVVTSVSKASQINRNPVPVISVNHDYLNNNLNTNIIDAIAKIPGINAQTTGPNVSKPIIRGLGSTRILTLFDGVRQEGQQWGDEHGIEVDQYGVERVEIIKGPASLTYGSDALAGVVNLIPTPAASEGRMIGNILAEYQTNNGLFGGSAMLGATNKGFEWMGRISHKEATNYQNKIDGRVYNTAFKETDANATFGLHRNWGYSHLTLSLFDDLQEIADGSRDSITRKFTKQITENDSSLLNGVYTYYRPIVSDAELKSYTISPLHQHVQHYRASLTNNFTIGNSRLAVNLGFQRSVRREFSHPELPYQDVPGLFLQLNTYSYDFKYYLPEMDGWNLTLGTNGMYKDNTVTNGTEFVIPTYHQFDMGPFIMAKKNFGKLDLDAGVRYDSRSFTNSELYTKPNPVSGFDTPVNGRDTIGADHPFYNYKHNFAGISGSVGLAYNFSEKLSVKANISRGFRAPNIAEISANGVHPGTNIYQIGNDQFKPEFSLQEDLGFTFTSKYAAITFSLFNNDLSNYIFNQKLLSVKGGDSVIVTNNQTFKFQQGKANLYGGELSVDIHPVKALHFENTLSMVYGDNKSMDAPLKTDSNKYLPFIPPLHGISELRYGFTSKSHHIVDGFVKVQVAYYAAQNRVYLADNTETATPGYTLFNAGVGAGFTNKSGKKIFDLYVMGNNLFNVAYQDHLSRMKYFEPYSYSTSGHYGIYNMGRNIAFKIEFPLNYSLKKS